MKKGMECLTNMKKEISENWLTFQMKTMEISISFKQLTRHKKQTRKTIATSLRRSIFQGKWPKHEGNSNNFHITFGKMFF